MKTRESSLWSWLRQAVSPTCMMVRVENSAGVGCADVFAVNSGKHFIVELKSAESDSLLIDCELRPEQASFLRRWVRAGGLAWVLVRVGKNQHYLVWADDSHWLLRPISEENLFNLSCVAIGADPSTIVAVMSHERQR